MPLLHGGSSKLRQGVLQLMIHSIDPMHSHHGGTIDPETGLVMVRNRRRSSGGQSNHRSSMGGEHSRPGTMTSKRGKNQEEDDDEDKKKEDEEDGENDAANDAGKKKDEDDERKGGGRNVDDDPAIVPGMISNGSVGGATGTTIRGERNNNPKGEGVTRTVRMPQVSIKNHWSLIQ